VDRLENGVCPPRRMMSYSRYTLPAKLR